ncbi:MAG: response regulator transcription factor [Actinomycetota bacterium]
MAAPTDRDRPLVLVVEDDQGVRESLAMVLEYREHDVVQATTGEDGLLLAESETPDLVILDINLPGIDGIETCRLLRKRGIDTPVLMLTARHEVADRVHGLDAGADDYLPKPFALDELLARVRSMLRRAGRNAVPPAALLEVGDLVLDPAARTVTRVGEPIELTKIEFDLLELLVANVGTVLTRDVIQERVWGYDDDLGSNSLEVFVSALRKKTERAGGDRLIHTIRGVGYVARIP